MIQFLLHGTGTCFSYMFSYAKQFLSNVQLTKYAPALVIFICYYGAGMSNLTGAQSINYSTQY